MLVVKHGNAKERQQSGRESGAEQSGGERRGQGRGLSKKGQDSMGAFFLDGQGAKMVLAHGSVDNVGGWCGLNHGTGKCVCVCVCKC